MTTKKLIFCEPKINFFYLDPPYKKINIEDILFSFSFKNILANNVLGIIEVPINSELKALKGFKIWGEKKVSKSLFYFIEKKRLDYFLPKSLSMSFNFNSTCVGLP